MMEIEQIKLCDTCMDFTPTVKLNIYTRWNRSRWKSNWLYSFIKFNFSPDLHYSNVIYNFMRIIIVMLYPLFNVIVFSCVFITAMKKIKWDWIFRDLYSMVYDLLWIIQILYIVGSDQNFSILNRFSTRIFPKEIKAGKFFSWWNLNRIVFLILPFNAVSSSKHPFIW